VAFLVSATDSVAVHGGGGVGVILAIEQLFGRLLHPER